jgi:hypothetical protein
MTMTISIYFTWNDMLDDKFYILWLHYQKWIIQILNEWMNEWMHEWTQTAYLPTAHISVAIITVLVHWNSNIWHHKCYCSLKSNTVLHTWYTCILMIIYIPNFTYLAPVVYWISDWQFAKEFHTSATLLLHIIWEWLPLQNFHIFWRFIIIHPPIQLSNSHSTCCSSLVGWHTCHVTFTDCKKLKRMTLWDGN